MKKLIIILSAVLAFSATANAQKFYAGGTADAELSFSKTFFGVGLSVSPEIGCYINDDIAVGVALTAYPHYDYNNLGDGENDWTSLRGVNVALTPYARWFAYSINKVRFFAEGNVNLGISFYRRNSYNFLLSERSVSDDSYTYYRVNLCAGMAYDITKRLTAITKTNVISYSGTFCFNPLSTIDFGVIYNF